MVVLQLLILISLTVVKFFQISPLHPCRSISTTSVNVKQIITTRLHPKITPEIMYRHFLRPHLTVGKPFFHTRYFSIQIQTSFWVALAFCSPQNKIISRFSSSSSHPISPLLFHGMCQHDHCDLLLHCHFVFLIEKPEWQSPNYFHLLPQVFGIKQVIFHPFPLFPLSGRDSSTIFLSAFPGNLSPSTDITFCDVSQSTDATQVRHTPPPG